MDCVVCSQVWAGDFEFIIILALRQVTPLNDPALPGNESFLREIVILAQRDELGNSS